MSDYLIQVERDSVCMGDDATAPNAYEFRIPSNATLEDVFEHLAKQHYLASVAGKNHSWEAILQNNSIALFKANNRFPEPTPVLTNPISHYTNGSVLHVYFKYNSAPD